MKHKRRALLLAATACPVATIAQQPPKIYRIGYRMNNRRRLIIALGACTSVSGKVFAQTKKSAVVIGPTQRIRT